MDIRLCSMNCSDPPRPPPGTQLSDPEAVLQLLTKGPLKRGVVTPLSDKPSHRARKDMLFVVPCVFYARGRPNQDTCMLGNHLHG